jgi:hypothetical protein
LAAGHASRAHLPTLAVLHGYHVGFTWSTAIAR